MFTQYGRKRVKIPANSNIYTKPIEQTLDRFRMFVKGTPNDIVSCISSAPLSGAAIQAIENSLEKLEFGRRRASYITILATDEQQANASLTPEGLLTPESSLSLDNSTAAQPLGDALTPLQLRLLVETLDPIAIIVTDGGAAALVSAAYQIDLSLNKRNRVLGRNVAVFEDFEELLSTPEKKQIAWRLLKQLS